jgi:DNA (cytosine-5)-methyltransferase 1
MFMNPDNKNDTKMKHISLFSGIGGFDLAADWMGWENVAHCEWNPFGRRVLNYYWPDADSHIDITKTDFRKYANKIDILSGGFPCQPYSQAGKRLGTADERHLWPEMLRAIREISPRWIVGENVRGLVNWSEGLVFEEVQTDLEAEGYEVQAFLLPASGVNAPHQRERIWFIAHAYGNTRGGANGGWEKEEKHVFSGNTRFSEVWSTSNPHNTRTDNPVRSNGNGAKESDKRKGQPFNEFGQVCGDDANPHSRRQPIEKHGEKESGRLAKTVFPNDWENFPTQSPICSGNDGVSNRLDRSSIYEGFTKPITFPKWRNESIKAYGNAVVPQVVYQIFKAIQDYENL